MEKGNKSALSVSGGVPKPPPVNPNLKKIRRRDLQAGDYVDGILAGDRSILSRAITLIESNLQEHTEIAQEIIRKCLPHTGNSIRVGITGVPGVGKSTFIEALGIHLITKGHKLAVLAIDPSSERSKGSILGDKTRMEQLAAEPNAFIRPSPSAGSLGGVARKTRESILLCEAAKFDVVFIETVGVGQSETEVHSMVDFFLLLMLSGAGDELQGIKRGIMEMADLLAITKADDDNIDNATRAATEYRTALHLFPLAESGWAPKVLTCSAREAEGISRIWDDILEYKAHTTANNYFAGRRRKQSLYWMHETIRESLRSAFFNNPQVKEKLRLLEEDVLNDSKSSFAAAKEILAYYFSMSGD